MNQTVRCHLIWKVLILLSLSQQAWGQTNLTFYNNRSLAQSILVNPAHYSRQAFTLGILDLSQQTYVPGITLYDFLRPDETANQSFNKIMNDDKYHFRDIRNAVEVNPLFIGFRVKRNYFSLGFQVVTDQDLSIPKELLKIGLVGNATPSAFGTPISLDDMKADITAHTALHAGIAREINDKLTIGIRGKLLFGLFDGRITKSDGYILLDSGENNAYRLSAKIDYEVDVSGADRIEKYQDELQKTQPDYVNNLLRPFYKDPLGKGFAFDLGFNYEISPRFSISGSAIDIGNIKWGKGTTYKRNASFSFEGFTDPDFDSLASNFDQLADSLEEIFKPNESTNPYTTKLNTKIYLGANYQVFNSGALGFVALGEFHKGNFFPGAAINYTQRIWKILDLRVGATHFAAIGTNLGVGVNIHLGPLVLYGSTDKLFGSVNYETTHFISNRIGVNINIGGRFDRDNDGVPDKKDKCKKVPGSPKFDGCPDTDGDGIADPNDECTDVKGPKSAKGCPDLDGDGVKDLADSCIQEKGPIGLFGCPDRDRDGIADKNDACPDDSGLVSTNGCPDRDGDGFLDKSDACPDQGGPSYTFGCPDFDGDSIPNKEDECPSIPGLRAFNGCPDTDKDGIPNKRDSCLGEAGPAYAYGCPDTDGDSIPDRYDNCPTEAGNKANMGCPSLDSGLVVLTEEEKKVLREAFNDLEFETGTAKISNESYHSLDELAELLLTRSTYKLEINGHTDNQGKAASNKKLSEDRAFAIKNYLGSKGVEGSRMEAKGFGSSKPIASNKTAEGRQKNRRVEFKIVK